MIPTIIPIIGCINDLLATRFVLGPDRALHCSAWLLDFFVMLLLVLYVNGVRFFLVKDQTEVVQLDSVCAYIHNNLHCSHMHKHKDQITRTYTAKIKNI